MFARAQRDMGYSSPRGEIHVDCGRFTFWRARLLFSASDGDGWFGLAAEVVLHVGLEPVLG
jgi:hypothetical protein